MGKMSLSWCWIGRWAFLLRIFSMKNRSFRNNSPGSPAIWTQFPMAKAPTPAHQHCLAGMSIHRWTWWRVQTRLCWKSKTKPSGWCRWTFWKTDTKSRYAIRRTRTTPWLFRIWRFMTIIRRSGLSLLRVPGKAAMRMRVQQASQKETVSGKGISLPTVFSGFLLSCFTQSCTTAEITIRQTTFCMISFPTMHTRWWPVSRRWQQYRMKAGILSWWWSVI